MMALCPKTGTRGKKVRTLTVRSLVQSQAQPPEAAGQEQWFLCDDPGCDVIYFTEAGASISKSELTVLVGFKEEDPPHTICYCFGHTEESVRDELAQTGESTVVESITAQVKAGECSCEFMNPSGKCCLGEVSKSVKKSRAELGMGEGVTATTPSAMDSPADDCCEPKATASEVARKQASGLLAIVGSVGAAVVASACCWLPLLLVAFGASAAGVSASFEKVRPLFLVVTVLLLGVGFYFVYFRKETCAPGTACAVPGPRLKRFNRCMLWVATVFVAAVALFPNYIGILATEDNSIIESADASTMTFVVEGMTCEACSISLRKGLEDVEGVSSASVFYDEGKAVVRLDDTATVAPEALIRVIERLGYTAKTTPALTERNDR